MSEKADRVRTLAGLVLEAQGVVGYKMTIDRAQEPTKLARGAIEGHVRAWTARAADQQLVALTIQRFRNPRAAARFVRREQRSARDVTNRFAVPYVSGVVALQTKRPGGMPDGRDGWGNVVLFCVGRLGVVVSHLGVQPQPPEFLARLAAEQHRRLASQ